MTKEEIQTIDRQITHFLHKREAAFSRDDPMGVLEASEGIDALKLIRRKLGLKDDGPPPDQIPYGEFVFGRIRDIKETRREVSAGIDVQKSGFEIRLRLLELATRMTASSGSSAIDPCGDTLGIAERLNAFVSSRGKNHDTARATG